MAENIGSAVLELRTDDRGLIRGIDEAEKRAKKFDNQLKAVIDTQKQLAIASAAAFAGVAGAITHALNASAGFEQQMARVRAVSQATNAEFKLLEQTARELGRTTQFTTMQAAEAMDFLAMAGFRVNEIVGAMPSVLQLAAAAQMDLGRAADIVTNIMTGFGIEVDKLAHVNDVLVAAMTGANTDLVQLGEAMKYAGPLAQAAGVQFEEAAAALALMGNAGIQASMAGTSLRGAITRLLTPTRQMQEVIDRLGLKTRDSSGNLASLADIIEQLERRGATAGDMMVLFGQRAGPAMQALVEQGSVALRQFTERLENSGGLAQRIADQQMDTLHGSVLRLESAWADLRIEIGDTFAPAARAAIDALTGLISSVSGLDQNTRQMILTLGSGTVGFVGALAATTTATWLLLRTWQDLRTGFLASMGPAGWLLLGLQAVLSLAAGLRAASFAADAAFKSLLASGDLDELQNELGKVNAEVEDLQKRIELMRQAGMQPEGFLSTERFEHQLNQLLEKREQIEKRIVEVKKEQEEAARLAAEAERLAELAAQGISVEWDDIVSTTDEASEAFKRWRNEVERIERETRVIVENYRVIRNLTEAEVDQAADQAQYWREIEKERVRNLEIEIEGLREKIALTERILNDAELTTEEQETLRRELERFNLELNATNHDLTIARDTLRLAERDDVFGRIARRAQLLRARLREGSSDSYKLLQNVKSLLDEVYDLYDGTLQWYNAANLVRSVYREIRDDVLAIGEVTAQLHVPLMPVPPEMISRGTLPFVQPAPTPRRVADEIIEAINTASRPEPRSILDRIREELRLLMARREAGIIPDAEVAEALIRFRAELLATVGTLSAATADQLALYNELSDALKDLYDELDQLPDKMRQLKELLDAHEAQLGAGLEIEREIAQATGRSFDRLAFEANVLQNTLRGMVEILGEIPEEAKPLLDRLGEITLELETTSVRMAMVNAGLDVFSRRLSGVDPALGRLTDTLKFSADGMLLGFNKAELMAQGLAFALEMLIDVIDDGSAEIERRIASMPDPGTDVLRIAQQFEAFEQLEANREARIAELRRLQRLQQSIDERTVGGALGGAALGAMLGSVIPGVGTLLGAALGGILFGGATRKAAVDEYGPKIEETEREIARLEDLIDGAHVELVNALGIGADTFAAGLQRALDSVSTDKFRDNLDAAIDDVIRSAMISTFIAKTIADDLQTITDEVQNAFLGGGSIEDIAARIDTDVIGAAKDSIEARAEVLRRVFEDLGLATEEATKGMREFSRTVGVPSGYKIEVPRFQTAIPVPLNADMLTTGSAAPQVREGDIIVNFNRDVFGLDDFKDVVKETVAEADRRASLSTRGVVRSAKRRH